MSRTEAGLYMLLETLLQEAEGPMTCVEMYDRQDVKDLATSSNRVSDYLGGLWRKGKVTRSVAVGKSANDGSRWAYSWRSIQPDPDADKDGTSQFVHSPSMLRKVILDKPNILITEDGSTITIDLPHLTITVQTKQTEG